jgi:hypothetical protein
MPSVAVPLRRKRTVSARRERRWSWSNGVTFFERSERRPGESPKRDDNESSKSSTARRRQREKKGTVLPALTESAGNGRRQRPMPNAKKSVVSGNVVRLFVGKS